MKILIASSDLSFRRLLAFCAEKLSHEVIVVPDGKSVLRILHLDSSDVLICDRSLADTDGTELCKTIRARKRSRLPYTILMGMNFEAKPPGDPVISGVDDFLEKPFDLDEFEMRLTKAGAALAMSGTDDGVGLYVPVYNGLQNNRVQSVGWTEYDAEQVGNESALGFCGVL